MKRLAIYLILFSLTLGVFARNEIDSLLLVLDKTIREHKIYENIKVKCISLLKENVAKAGLPQEIIYRLNEELYEEYRSYISDSAIHYLYKNLDLSEVMHDRYRQNKTKFQLAYVLASTGMYKESIDILDAVDVATLDSALLIDYYISCDRAYGELTSYSQDKRKAVEYAEKSKNYKDVLLKILDKDSDLYLSLQEAVYRDNKEFDKAEAINDIRLERCDFGSMEYALVAFHRALLYRCQDDVEQFKKYLILSALSDIKSGIKDQASLWTLADILYKEGDINRAYNYICFSWEESQIYNARLRVEQISKVLSVINNTYQLESERKSRQLRFYLILISVLSLFLLVSIVYIYKQMRSLAIARNNLEVANKQLNGLNRELSEMNGRLKDFNFRLSESNHVKEEYIGRFMTLCSTYIDKLEAYRRMVNKKLQSGQSAELYKITKASNITEEELKEFYQNFDTTFLFLYPDFVAEFNALLVDEEHIVLKKGELLNTELRIFALIRLGISDSSKIAEFLRYSVNTIYNYRAKVKNKAKISRDDFESQVMQIGSFSK